ncbi:hypothetical protein [Streptomyces camelliae]|uniref:MDMPI C-terminal domain-containing protein n=1 Tax=Streptomyces camelliae TaxID=3004093 RepID=A0ABY7P559_9ACTN|nr:hypothetical protein [Streptomyces sp. HUAS 2-6]WBO65676.1 hypothetical protein O1G22_24075 [Streptomyces sp. HUAS 2-6]
MTVHTYDAQLAVGAPRPLPDEVALDGVEEFLSTFCTTTVVLHEPAAVDHHTAEGRPWRNWLSGDGARAARLPAPGTMPAATSATSADQEPDAAAASARGTAHELVLALYCRIPLDSPKLDGDRRLFDQLVGWDPER